LSIVNDKLFDIYDIKPQTIDDFIDNYHRDFDGNTLMHDKCPACGSGKYRFAFDKYVFHYVECQECCSLYVQNAVSPEELKKYSEKINREVYAKSEYVDYLEVLAEKTNFDLEVMFSRFLSIEEDIDVCYIGNKSTVFARALEKFNVRFVAYSNTLDDATAQYDLIIMDHHIEKAIDTGVVVRKAYENLKMNGHMYILSRVGSGLDILTLWEESKLYPIEHRNVLSIDGLKMLMESHGFKVKEASTPGTLDIDNVINSSSEKIPRFFRYLKSFHKENALEELRAMIQKNLLSSFSTVLVQKVK
jgi:hypothetical protein